MILVLVGPHGAGKTTLGRALSRRLGLPYDPELGREMAEDPRWRPAGATAAERASAFDLALFRRELSRDAQRLQHSLNTPHAIGRVVETWHPGNLAYAIRRSPGLAARFGPRLARASQGAVVLPLSAPRHVLAARQSEPGDLDFFLEVGADASRIARAWGLTVLPTLDTSLPPSTLIEHVAGVLGQVPSSARCQVLLVA